MSEDMNGNDPWDDFFNDDFSDMRKRMDQMIRQLMKGSIPMDTEPMIYGFSMRVGPDGRPRIQEFGNASSPRSFQESRREPLTDIIEESGRIRIVVELPGVEKTDIHLNATEEAIDIDVDNPNKRFSKHLDLPCEVDPDSTRASYKNGVLEILLSRVEKRTRGKTIKIE